MSKKVDHHCLILFSVLLCLFCVTSGGGTAAAGGKLGDDVVGCVVKRNEREPIVSTEFGEISRVRLSDGNRSFQLHFITLEPNSLLLPLLLHEDMVFFVRTGSGVVSYLDVDEDKRESRNLKRGDVHRLRAGSVFYLQSDLDDPERQKLRLHAIFGNSGPDFTKAAFEPYTTIRDLVLGFDKQVLQQIFQVPEEVIEEMTSKPKPPAIIHAIPSREKNKWEEEQEYLIDLLLGSGNMFHLRNKEKKSKVYNIYSEKPDFKNCNGWSTTVNRKKYSPLRNSQYGIFMVNLTAGSMMGPHWNPMATEIAVVIEGKGMVRVACSSGLSDTECKNTRISVEEGDAFVVPRYHPMGHMAFNNETFVFVGFSTATRKNHPQFLAGQASVLRTLDKEIVARSFGVSNETLDRLLVNQGESVILKCTSCAEEEWRLMQEEIKKEREEEREREQEEARRKEEEQRRRQEEEEAKKREEEAERQRREEQEREEREREEAKRKEEEHRRQEEERRRQEEEEAKKQEEEAEQHRREEQEREDEKRKEEEQRRREEERRKQEEEEAARQEREEQEREEAKRKEKEQKRQEEERQKQEEEEAERQRREQQEREEREREASRQQEQEEQEAREREEAARREREEQQAEERERQRQQEEREAQEKEEAARREREEEKERQTREREEEEAREQEEAQKRREEEQEQEQAEREARQRAQEQERAQQQKEQREAEARSEEEAARREEEEPESQEQEQQEEQGSRHEGQQETEEVHRGEGTGMRRTV